MDEIKQARLALLEGNRDEVLKVLEKQSETPEVIWLRANAIEDDAERLALLRRLINSNDIQYARLAQEILLREDRYESELSVPPSYQFWKQESWRRRVENTKRKPAKFILSIIGIVLALSAFIVVSSLLSHQRKINEAEAIEQTKVVLLQLSATPILPTPTPSIQPLPPRQQASVSYAAGTLTLIRVEFPTTRPVSYSSYNTETLATPAVGSQFAAAQLEFRCQLPLCSAPPQAVIVLKLDNDQTIMYEGGSQPVLVEQPAMERVSSGKSVLGWFVFEVPEKSTPKALLIWTGDEEQFLEIPWPR